MEFPDLPWALFELNNHHNLTMADCFPKWPDKLGSLTAKDVISSLKSQISRYGIQNEMITDNGRQVAPAAFAEF